MPSSAGSRQVDVALTEREQGQTERLLGDPTVFPQVFKNWVSAWTEQDTSIALAQVQGWNDYLNQQTAKDSAQDTSIAANTAGISAANSSISTIGPQITALQNSDATQNSTIAGHTSSISSLGSTNSTQDTRLAALEAKTIPRILASQTTVVQQNNINGLGEWQLTSLALPANVLPVPGICEFFVVGSFVNQAAVSYTPLTINVYFGTTQILGLQSGSVMPVSAVEWPWTVKVTCMNTSDKSHQQVATEVHQAQAGNDTVTTRIMQTAVATGTASRAFALKVASPPNVSGFGYSAFSYAAYLTLVAGT